MMNYSSFYGHLATYVDEIIIWSKDPMAVIKSLKYLYLKCFEAYTSAPFIKNDDINTTTWIIICGEFIITKIWIFL
jgi:hypothetical protein